MEEKVRVVSEGESVKRRLKAVSSAVKTPKFALSFRRRIRKKEIESSHKRLRRGRCTFVSEGESVKRRWKVDAFAKMYAIIDAVSEGESVKRRLKVLFSITVPSASAMFQKENP